MSKSYGDVSETPTFHHTTARAVFVVLGRYRPGQFSQLWVRIKCRGLFLPKRIVCGCVCVFSRQRIKDKVLCSSPHATTVGSRTTSATNRPLTWFPSVKRFFGQTWEFTGYHSLEHRLGCSVSGSNARKLSLANSQKPQNSLCRLSSCVRELHHSDYAEFVPNSSYLCVFPNHTIQYREEWKRLQAKK